jgi:hypothetical protein
VISGIQNSLLLGVGSAIEREAERKLQQSMATAQAAGRGDLREAGRRTGGAILKVLAGGFKQNKRK